MRSVRVRFGVTRLAVTKATAPLANSTRAFAMSTWAVRSGAPVTAVRATGAPLLTAHVDIANARGEFANSAVALGAASRVTPKPTRTLRIFPPNGYHQRARSAS